MGAIQPEILFTPFLYYISDMSISEKYQPDAFSCDFIQIGLSNSDKPQKVLNILTTFCASTDNSIYDENL